MSFGIKAVNHNPENIKSGNIIIKTDGPDTIIDFFVGYDKITYKNRNGESVSLSRYDSNWQSIDEVIEGKFGSDVDIKPSPINIPIHQVTPGARISKNHKLSIPLVGDNSIIAHLEYTTEVHPSYNGNHDTLRSTSLNGVSISRFGNSSIKEVNPQLAEKLEDALYKSFYDQYTGTSSTGSKNPEFFHEVVGHFEQNNQLLLEQLLKSNNEPEEKQSEEKQSQPELNLIISEVLRYAGFKECALLHASLLAIKNNPNLRMSFSNNPDNYDKPEFPNEIEDVFSPTYDQKSWVNHAINKISQNTATSARVKDFILASSGGSFQRRFMNMLGAYDDHTEKANQLGANLLGAVGGAVKSDKDIKGVGGPIPMDELDIAIEQVEREFLKFNFKPTDHKSSVFETLKLVSGRILLKSANNFLSEQKPPTSVGSISEIAGALKDAEGDDKYVQEELLKYEKLIEGNLPKSLDADIATTSKMLKEEKAKADESTRQNQELKYKAISKAIKRDYLEEDLNSGDIKMTDFESYIRNEVEKLKDQGMNPEYPDIILSDVAIEKLNVYLGTQEETDEVQELMAVIETYSKVSKKTQGKTQSTKERTDSQSKTR